MFLCSTCAAAYSLGVEIFAYSCRFSLELVHLSPLCSTGMLKDVEDELQRKVKVLFLASLWSGNAKEIIPHVLNIASLRLHPQSTRSRQGEQRNPEVELEVRLAVFIPHFCLRIYFIDLSDIKPQSKHQLSLSLL